MSAVVAIAAQFGTGVGLPELLRLLPNEAPATIPEVRDWLADHPHVARTDGEAVYAPGSARTPGRDRQERGRRYLRSAEELLSGPLRGVLPWVRCVCVTGSTAYGEPEAGDDLDLFVVTTTGAMWWFVARTYLALRIAHRHRTQHPEPTPCFNFVLEEREAVEEFARIRGFLFAREALTARTVRGEAFYRELLSHAPWMAQEIPRLYAEKNPHPLATMLRPSPASRAVRLLNLIAFPWVAAYLQLVGLRRNGQFRRSGRNEQRFRTETRWRRLAFTSEKFEQLKENLRPAAAQAPVSVRRSEVGAR